MVKLVKGELRFRQEEAHDKIINSYKNGNKEFLLAASCRFGKTVTATKTCYDLSDGDQIILIISAMSVKEEWISGCEMVGYGVDLLNTEINGMPFNTINNSGRHVIFCSIQKLGNNSESSKNLIKLFNKYKGLHVLVFDECHLASGTERTQKEIIERLNFDFKLYISGTPYRDHLREEFSLDLLETNKSFIYTINDEWEDYKNGKITTYVPVRIEMYALSKTEIKTTEYFGNIFSDYKKYSSECKAFIDLVLEAAEKKQFKNILFFVARRIVGDQIIEYYENVYKKKYGDKIEFRNLCGEYSGYEDEYQDEAEETTEIKKLNSFYSNESEKIKITITCNKCGTGATIRDLEAEFFLCEITSAISFIQKSQRVRTPKDGKEKGYVFLFNELEGLAAWKGIARNLYHKNDDNDDNVTDEDAIDELINNSPISLYCDLDCNPITNYNEIADRITCYHPGDNTLFIKKLDEIRNNFKKEDFAFLIKYRTITEVKDQLTKEYSKSVKDSKEFKKAIKDAETAAELQKVLDEHNINENVEELTNEKFRQKLVGAFELTIKTFHTRNKTTEYIINTQNYDNNSWLYVNRIFGTKPVWEYILKEYPFYVNMVYKYFTNESK